MQQTVFLHLGAHRTGTTHFQMTMERNRGLLDRAAGRFVVLQKNAGFHDIMVGMRRALGQGAGSATKRLGAFVDAHRDILAENSDVRVLALTAEGQLGGMGFNNRRSTLYPSHERIIKEIARAYEGKRLIAAISIRSYDDYIESVYKHGVRSSCYTTSFEQYSKQIRFEELSWLPIVRSLTDAFGAGNVIVWSHEAYRDNQPEFYRWLLGRLGIQARPEDFRISPEHKNLSPSALLLRVQRTINRALSRTLPKKRAARLALRTNIRLGHQLGARWSSRPKLLPPALKRRLRERYADDLATIRAMLPETSFVQP